MKDVQKEYDEELKALHGFVPLIMGTKLDVLILGLEKDSSEILWENITAEAERLDRMLNRFCDDSEVSMLNSEAPFENVPVSVTLAEMLRLCGYYSFATDGLFDVTRGHAGEMAFDGDSVLSMGDCSLDFGGFAKGFFVKWCKQELEAAGAQRALVNFGNSTILAVGNHPLGDAWPVDVMNPYDHSSVTTVSLKDRTLSISGNTPGYCGHIVDPRSGEGVRTRKLVSVVSPDPLTAEVLSTVGMIADVNELEKIRERFPDTEITVFEL